MHWFCLVPIANYFSIQMYYGVGDIQNWNEYMMTGFVDFCDLDFISRLELLHMANDLNINLDGCNLWWNESMSELVTMTEIKTNAIRMTSSVG